jgi:hypothetical protein
MRGRRPRHRGQPGRCFACINEWQAERPRRCILGAITRIDDRRRGVRGWGLGGLAEIAGGRRRGLWVRVDAGPHDAAERVMDDRLVGSGLGDDRMRRRGVFSGGVGLLLDGVRMVIRISWAWFSFRCVGAYVCRINLVESVG